MSLFLSSTNVNNVISASVSQFMKYIKETHNISTEHVDINKFLVLYQEKRKFKPSKDTFLYICEYLNWNDIIKLTTLCQDFMEYYPNIWNIIHKQVFPLSITDIIPYNSIKEYTSIKCYERILTDKYINNKKYFNINKSEQYIYIYTQCQKPIYRGIYIPIYIYIYILI